MTKGKFQAAFEGKCPRCREGNLFTHSHLQINKFSSTNEKCEVCGLKYEKEPGFFYGAMYVSYVFAVGMLMVTTFVLYFFFNDPSVVVYITSVTAVSALLYPFNFRFSRIVFLYVFGGVKYNPSLFKK